MAKISYRPLKHSDLEIRVKWLNNPMVSRYLGSNVREGTTLAKQEEWFSKYKDDKSRELFVILADDIPVGNVGITNINLLDRNASLFIMIGEESYWGKGIAKEAIRYIVNYGFDKLNLHKIWLYVYSINERARNLYRSVEFIEEARLKAMVIIDNKFYDEIVMAIFNTKE